MKQFGLRFLYKHLGQALKEMPFEITNHNRVIAVVLPAKGRIFTEETKGDAVEIYPLLTSNEPKELN
jgi:hypothetical protein